MKQNYKPSRPHLWKAGPDKELRARRLAFLRSRCQARFRKEEWSLTLDDWYELGPLDLWRKRGKRSEDYIITFIEIGKGWHRANVEVRQRRGNMRRHYYHRRGQTRTIDTMPNIAYNKE